MTIHDNAPDTNPGRRDERGAALVTTLLVAALLLIVSGGLLIRTSMSSITSIDSTAEAQAYYAAEAGMQAALNVLRGNASGTAVSFAEAATPSSSNQGGVSFTDARMSRWLSYTYPTSSPNRVVFDNTLGYSVKIIAPDTATPGIPPVPPSELQDDDFEKPDIAVKPPKPSWHPHHCGHCSWDYTHCGMWGGSDAASGVPGTNPKGCRHNHCKPTGWKGSVGTDGDDGYQRLIVQVTGYGPKGARKDLEMLVHRTMFQYEIGSPLLLQGAMPSGGGLTFNVSKDTKISGKDEASKNTQFPAIVFTQEADLSNTNVVNNSKDDIKESEPESLAPHDRWLTSADTARLMVDDLQQSAVNMGRYFSTSPATGNLGTTSIPLFTFVNGNASLTGKGAGLLVVTGELTITAKFEFEGLILVLGAGKFHGTTSTDSKIKGSMVIARFSTTGDFLAPTFNMATGKLEMKMNSALIDPAIDLVGLKVLGVHEY